MKDYNFIVFSFAVKMIQLMKLIIFSCLFFTGFSVTSDQKSDLCANDWVDATYFGLGKSNFILIISFFCFSLILTNWKTFQDVCGPTTQWLER